MMGNGSYNSTVIQKILMTPGLMTLRIRPDIEVPAFKPGQYTVLGLYNTEPRIPESEPDPKAYGKETLIKRAYSITSSSVEREYIEFYISLVRSGELTPRLFTLGHGSRLFIDKRVSGMFTLDKVPAKKDVVFIATGTGLAPYMSMIRSELHRRRSRKYVVLHGASFSWDLGYRDELATMDRLVNSFYYLPTVTEPEEDPTWKGWTDLIQPIITSGRLEETMGDRLTPDIFDVFLCGNPLMIEEVSKILIGRGFRPDEEHRPGTLHMEKYWQTSISYYAGKGEI